LEGRSLAGLELLHLDADRALVLHGATLRGDDSPLPRDGRQTLFHMPLNKLKREKLYLYYTRISRGPQASNSPTPFSPTNPARGRHARPSDCPHSLERGCGRRMGRVFEDHPAPLLSPPTSARAPHPREGRGVRQGWFDSGWTRPPGPARPFASALPATATPWGEKLAGREGCRAIPLVSPCRQ